MQQTETYKLNLIERTDVFSPDPLNENAQKVEAKLGALDSAAAGLDSRVTALEVHKIAIGTYTGIGKKFSIHVGFSPVAVLLSDTETNGGLSFVLTKEAPCRVGAVVKVQLTEDGFEFLEVSSVNTLSRLFNYIAFA